MHRRITDRNDQIYRCHLGNKIINAGDLIDILVVINIYAITIANLSSTLPPNRHIANLQT
jgi:hypothetical protein